MEGQSIVTKIMVTGIVQGVGFRPFVFNLAQKYELCGSVKNTSAGVEIILQGTQVAIETFINELQTAPPPLARLDSVTIERNQAINGYTQFEILASESSTGDFIPLSPDIAICPDCSHELFDPSDRRFRYPFINCTNCGPRFTIIRDIPYDRPYTTMAGFNLCADCQQEYDDPKNRRFHAQPIACPSCGPQVWFSLPEGERLADGDNAIQKARDWLAQGKILAIKGLGGYHLACDATNSLAVDTLRRRKKRSDKPFAIMLFDLPTVERHCHVSQLERSLLQSFQQPVVLLDRLPASSISADVAPHLSTLGVMLPYTPLHLLLLQPAPGFPDALVMTSGNLSEEPIAYQDEEALIRLAPLADAFLLHNRPIQTRVDDSVIMASSNKPYITRRSRGYAPNSLKIPVLAPPLLAAGAELKNTFCLSRDHYAFLSHHIGDLENLTTLRSYEEGIRHFEKLFRIQPQGLACDLHPNYLSTRYAIERAEQDNLPLVQVQHHHAHLAACLADNGWASPDPVIGLIFDGTGYGTDGTIWGGEFLVGGYSSFQRSFHLKDVPLPGGDLSVKKTARMALSHLWASGIEWEVDLPPVESVCYEERTVVRAQLERKLNTPLTSSMGRLFDAAAALIGIRQAATYEGQAAIELESCADPTETSHYQFSLEQDTIDPTPLWEQLLADWRKGVRTAVIAARFHNSIAALSAQLCDVLRNATGIRTVCLSGGVWQNRFLMERTNSLLQSAGFEVLSHQQVPTNDGGIALGQILVAAYASISE